MLTLFLAIGLTTVSAQSNNDAYRCYRIAVDQGLKSVRNKDFGQAVQQFNAAYSCNYEMGKDSLQLLLNQSAKALNVAKIKAEKAEVLAKQNEAEEARLKEVAQQALKEKEKALEAEEIALLEAKRQGKRVEARRVLELVDEASEAGNHEEALVMAFAGIMLGGEEVIENGMKVFGRAVRDSLSRTIYSSEIPIEALDILSTQKTVMALSQGEVNIIDHHGGSKDVISFKPIMNEVADHIVAPIGNHLVFWAAKKVQLWSPNGVLIQEYTDHDDNILFANFSNDERYLITCSRDNTAVLRNLNTNSFKRFVGHRSPIYEAKFSLDNNYLLTRSSDGLVIVWDTDGNEKCRIGGDEVYIYDADFNATSDKIVTASAKGMVKIWNLSGQAILELNDHQSAVKEVRFLPNTDQVISRSTKNVKLWNGDQEIIDVSNNMGRTKGMQASHLQLGTLLWGKNKSLRFVEHKDGKSQEFLGLNTDVNKAIFSPLDDYFLTTSKDESVMLWDTRGLLLIDWNSNNQYPLSAIFSESGDYVLTISSDRRSVSSCPIPKNVFEKMKVDLDYWKEAIQKVIVKYQLEFMDSNLGND